jgi:hypothetical protein
MASFFPLDVAVVPSTLINNEFYFGSITFTNFFHAAEGWRIVFRAFTADDFSVNFCWRRLPVKNQGAVWSTLSGSPFPMWSAAPTAPSVVILVREKIIDLNEVIQFTFYTHLTIIQ